MILNLLFFTLTISKRQYSNDEIQKAYNLSQMEAQVDQLKTKQYSQQIKFL